MSKKMFNSKTNLLLVILLISAIIRFHRLSYFAGFDFDQELAATEAAQILEGDFTLIGQEVSTGGIFVGPFYNYATALMLLVFNYDPYALFFFQALLGIISTYAIYKVTEKIHPHAGIISALLYAVMFRFVYMDKTAAPSNWLPFLTILGMWILTSWPYRRGKLLALCSLAGFASQLHPVGIGLFVLPAWFWWRQKHYKQLSTYVVAIISFSVWFVPLLLFDIRHQWLNLQGLLHRSETLDYPLLFRLISRFRLTLDSWFTLISFERNLFVLLLVLILVIGYGRKLRTLPGYMWIGLVINPLIFSIYKGSVLEYYLLPSWLFVLVVLSVLVVRAWQTSTYGKIISSLALVAVLGSNLWSYINFSNPVSLAHKKMAMHYIQEQNIDQPRIHIQTQPGQNNGFIYLADWYELEAQFTHEDPDFVIKIPTELNATQASFGRIGVESY